MSEETNNQPLKVYGVTLDRSQQIIYKAMQSGKRVHIRPRGRNYGFHGVMAQVYKRMRANLAL